MTKQRLKQSVGGLAVLLLLAPAAAHAQSATPVASFDLTRAPGNWYELARLPYKREKVCVTDAVQLVAPGDKDRQLRLVGSCKEKEGYADAWTTFATQAKGGKGQFSVRTIWPLSKKYLVLATGPSYEWVLVGTANHKNLWIYAKTPTLAPELMSDIQSKATAAGYHLDKLITVPHTPVK